MKNYDLFVLADQLASSIDRLKSLKGAKFNYCVLKNIDVLEKEVKMLMESVKPGEAFVAYDKARVALCEQFTKKDENGQLLKKEVAPGQFEYDIDTTSAEWLDAITKLKEEYATVISERDEQVRQYNEMLELESDVQLRQVRLDDVPNDISLDLMKVVKPFISE